MRFLKSGNWGLRVLALVLAIVIYHALKNKSASSSDHFTNDRYFFQSR